MKRYLLLLAFALVPFFAFGQNAEDDPDVLYAKTLLPAGRQAPDFLLKDLNGKQWSLTDFRGNYVILAFWASWCPDCRAEIPELRRMAEKYEEKNVRFLCVSFDRSLEKLKEFAAEEPLVGVQLFDPAGKKDSKISASYGVQWIPSLFLVAPDGRILKGTVVASRIEEALDKVLDFESKAQLKKRPKVERAGQVLR